METVTCELCGSASHQVVLEQYDLAHRITDDLFTVVRCRICGLLFLNPRPTREEIGGYYPSTYYPAAPPRQAGDLKRAAKRWSAQVRRWIAQDFYGYPITDARADGNGCVDCCSGRNICGAAGVGAGSCPGSAEAGPWMWGADPAAIS